MTPTEHRPPHGAHQHDEHLYDDNPHNEDVAHEHSDVNVRALLIFCVGLVAVAVVVHIVVYGLMALFESQAADNDPVRSPYARPAGQLPPEPRLLTDEAQNLMRFRATQSEGLTGIDAAKKQLLEQGLPVRADAPEGVWQGTRSPAGGESSGGRMIPLRPGDQAATPPAATTPPATPAQPPKSGGH